MHAAIKSGNLALVQKLIDADAKSIEDLNSLGNRPLHEACYLKQTAIASFLVSRGADPNANGDRGRTPLHCAVIDPDGESLKICRLLVNNGADVNLTDNLSQQNVLGYAVRELADESTINYLQQVGAAMDIEAAMLRNDMNSAIKFWDPENLHFTKGRLRSIAELGQTMNHLLPHDTSPFVDMIKYYLANN